MEAPTPTPTIREQLFNKVFVKTPVCSEKLADVQLIPGMIDMTRFNGLTDRKGNNILQGMIVSYKYINEAGKTMQVINSRVLKHIPCIEYQLPAGHPLIFLSGVTEKRNDWVEDHQKEKFCNNQFESYKNKELPVPVNIPFDIDITGSSIGKRMFGSVNAGSQITRKYKKKRARGSKKIRGSVKRRTRVSSRKRK
jgi:hypothetical protein